VCLFSSPTIFRRFLLVEREGLNWDVDIRIGEHTLVLVLLIRDLQLSFFSFGREYLDHEGLSLRERV